MNNKGKKIWALVLAGGLMVGTAVVSGQAATLATEEQVEGAGVLIDEYCSDVAAGMLTAKSLQFLGVGDVTGAAVNAAEKPEASPEPTQEPEATPAPTEEPTEEPAHVELNLNYSRLGIANKVDTYLNVRKKPSKRASIVGKLTKNAGCHIYNIKNGWAKIVSGDVRGYVKASYLTTDEKAEELAKEVGRNCVEIQTNSLRVRALPTTSAPIYSVISEGEEFVIKKENLTLLKARREGEEGFREQVLRGIFQPGVDCGVREAVFGQPLCVGRLQPHGWHGLLRLYHEPVREIRPLAPAQRGGAGGRHEERQLAEAGRSVLLQQRIPD